MGVSGPGQWVGLTTQLPRLDITMEKINPAKKLHNRLPETYWVL